MKKILLGMVIVLGFTASGCSTPRAIVKIQYQSCKAEAMANYQSPALCKSQALNAGGW